MKMKNLAIVSLVLLVLAPILGAAQIFQVGGLIEGVQPIQVYKGQTKTMPQITATHTLDEDGSDGTLLYLYGTYQIEEDSQALTQIHTQTYPTVEHTFNNLGTYTYTAVIMFAQLEFNYETGQWETIESGVDTSTEVSYEVLEIPEPDSGFLANLLSTLLGILCSLFPTMPGCCA